MPERTPRLLHDNLQSLVATIQRRKFSQPREGLRVRIKVIDIENRCKNFEKALEKRWGDSYIDEYSEPEDAHIVIWQGEDFGLDGRREFVNSQDDQIFDQLVSLRALEAALFLDNLIREFNQTIADLPRVHYTTFQLYAN